MNFLVRIFQHFADRSLAEIQTMILALSNSNKFLQPFKVSQNRFNTTEPFAARHARIMRVAGQLNLILIRHRHDAVQEIRDPLPINVVSDLTGNRGSALVALGVIPG